MKTLVLKSFLALVFFMGSAMISAPSKGIYYGACDVYPEGVEVSKITQPDNGNFEYELSGNRFSFTCESSGVYKVTFQKTGYKKEEVTFTIPQDNIDHVTIFGDVRLVQAP